MVFFYITGADCVGQFQPSCESNVMRTSKLKDAKPHIEKAKRSLEMLERFIENKDKLSLRHRAENYYNGLVESVLAIQDLLLTDNEYTERMAHSMSQVNVEREYKYRVTANNSGEVFYDVSALMPLKEMRKDILLTGKIRYDKSVSRAKAANKGAT